MGIRERVLPTLLDISIEHRTPQNLTLSDQAVRLGSLDGCVIDVL
jgi:hypothetical protein